MAEKIVFKVGDVVVLKAGSPRMTVEKYTPGPDPRVETVWFLGSEREGWGAVARQGPAAVETPTGSVPPVETVGLLGKGDA
jgi:uncharacterized protein YodC (DUF2158 family)